MTYFHRLTQSTGEDKGAKMTVKEIKKLSRTELIETAIYQNGNIERLKAELERVQQRCGDLEIELSSLEDTLSRLKAKLDVKDAELERLNDELEETYRRLAHKLDIKDNRIRQLKAAILKSRPDADIITTLLSEPCEAEEYDSLPAQKVKLVPVKPAKKRGRKPERAEKKSTGKLHKPAKTAAKQGRKTVNRNNGKAKRR